MLTIAFPESAGSTPHVAYCAVEVTAVDSSSEFSLTRSIRYPRRPEPVVVPRVASTSAEYRDCCETSITADTFATVWLSEVVVNVPMKLPASAPAAPVVESPTPRSVTISATCPSTAAPAVPSATKPLANLTESFCVTVIEFARISVTSTGPPCGSKLSCL